MDMQQSNNAQVLLAEAYNLFDIERIGAAQMSAMTYEYVSSGAADEFTVKWNREKFDEIKLNPSVLNDVSHVDMSVNLFGEHMPHPLIIAPTAFHKIMHTDGELATAKAAGRTSSIYTVSSFTTTTLEEIKQAATSPLWFQLYVRDDRSLTKDVVQKAEALGFKALVVTVDSPVFGVRNRQDKIRFELPHNLHAPYANFDSVTKTPITWKDIEWLQSLVNIPVLLKGILNNTDALIAIESGVSGIIVSNHSGRNLDTVPATIEALPRIAESVNKKIPVLMDGGIRRGTDVLKAIALGADAVLVGKPVCYGLACGGADGVEKVLQILKTEFEIAMKLTGKSSIAAIDETVIWK